MNTPRKLLSLSELEELTGMKRSVLVRYARRYQDRIPSIGLDEEQRFPPRAVPIFLSIAKEVETASATSAEQTLMHRELNRAPAAGMPKNLLRLSEISKLTGISYPSLVRYLRTQGDRIPGVGEGRERRFPPEAVEIFRVLRQESGRGGRKESSQEPREETGEEMGAENSPDGRGLVVTLDFISPELWRALTSNPEVLRSLHWREFEKVLAGLLERMEYEIELQQGTKDGGVDIFAIKRSGPLGPHRYLLQAKRSARIIGVEPVRELLFLHSEHRVSKSCLATTSRFTKGAWTLADQHSWQLELRDFTGLKEWVQIAVKSQ